MKLPIENKTKGSILISCLMWILIHSVSLWAGEPFFHAIKAGNLEEVVQILSLEGDSAYQIANAPGPDGKRPLELAIEGDHQKMARVLIKAGAAPMGSTLHYSADNPYRRRLDHGLEYLRFDPTLSSLVRPDPCKLSEKDLLVAHDKIGLEEGVLYHGTPDYRNVDSMIDGQLVSSPINGYWYATHGRGFYVTPSKKDACSHTEHKCKMFETSLDDMEIIPFVLNSKSKILNATRTKQIENLCHENGLLPYGSDAGHRYPCDYRELSSRCQVDLIYHGDKILTVQSANSVQIEPSWIFRFNERRHLESNDSCNK